MIYQIALKLRFPPDWDESDWGRIDGLMPRDAGPVVMVGGDTLHVATSMPQVVLTGLMELDLPSEGDVLTITTRSM